MPQAGVSVPRGNVHRGDRWSDDLELDFPSRRPLAERRASRPPAPTVPAVEHDPYNLDLDLHFDLGLTSDRAAGRREPRRASPAGRPAAAHDSVAGAADAAHASLAGPPEPGPASFTAPQRRTVTIHGRPSDRYRLAEGTRRRQPPAHHRAGFQPDRVAMWAVLLGLVLLLVAATSSHAAVLSAHGIASLAAR